MKPTTFICLLYSLGSAFAYQVNEKEPIPIQLPLRPGDLLRSLDELTSDVQIIYSPLQGPSRLSANRRVYDSENPSDNEDQASEDDYDRAYEDFVTKYFNKAEADLDLEDEEEEKSANGDYAVPFESTDDNDDVDGTKPKQKSVKSRKCKRVQIDDQNCVVCEDRKTNEKSKSCSYSSESKPKNYGFSRERSKKRSNKDHDNEHNRSDEKENADDRKPLKRATVGTIQPRRTSIDAFVDAEALSGNKAALKCLKKLEDGLVCFYCGTLTDNTRECMLDKSSPKKPRVDDFSKKDSKTKKVYKRMVTYSYKNDGNLPKVDENSYAVFRGY